MVRTLLPAFQVVLLFDLGPGRAEVWPITSAALAPVYPLVGSGLLGPVKTAWQYRLAGGARVLAVTFTLAGFYRLFQIPVVALGPGLTDPDALVGHRCFTELWEQLRFCSGPAQLGSMLTAFCLPYLRAADASQAELLAHLPLLAPGSHLNPLKVLAAASHRSERAVQLRFQKYLGFSAKEAARFLRFRLVLADLPHPGRHGATPDWGALLEHYGYYDQSHLVHDFRHFLQQPPSKVAGQLRLGGAICVTQPELLGPHS
ncbi:helix-turn-helix domain-containing protein [Hymenobacter sp. 5516J-16]|uniref:helix-turn-helix domain-containing protein n=1 Tax=Hymenobacter sp. 5516J-16 TaxID=2932253 RepID=UPI001FD490F9|nr:helix-turn-helix domain-containing protein [Hymenobacter sp. 5516J-16]UOQ77773.1 helix-turn-helix domain-containing protein [Hymenobacter sp. 5516J-16]